MATSQVSEVIQHLRRTVLLFDRAGLTDGQLLENYLSRRDEAALAALVRRHAPMVWGVCRRILRNHHDAEDAFQATFLVLVRRAGSIAQQELLANWLYGVAHQTAVKARAMVARRKGREKQVMDMPEPAVADQALWDDLQPLLDAELSNLPTHYRVVIVLCDLDHKTRKETARQLGLPEGTVASRLTRARAMLAKRLAQRGVALSGGALAAVLTENVASAGAPSSVVSATIDAARLLAAGPATAGGAISPKVAALTNKVLNAMLISKLKMVIAVVLSLCLMATGTAVLTCRVAAAQGDQRPGATDMPPARIDGDAGKMAQRSGYLQLEHLDLVKGIIEGNVISTDDARTIYSHRQEIWELKVGPATKIVIDGKPVKLADLRTIKPEPGSSDGGMKLVFVEWEHAITADPKVRVKQGTAIRLEGKGPKARGIIQATNPGKKLLTIKTIHGGLSGELVAEMASDVPVAEDAPVIIDHKAAAFNDLKPGMKVALQFSAVKEMALGIQAYGAKVDGVLKFVDAGKNTVSVNIPSAQMTAEGISVAQDARVIIDGKAARLADLRAGMRVTLQMSAEPQASLIVGVTKDKTPARE